MKHKNYTRQELLEAYNAISKRVKAAPNKPADETLAEMSDEDLFVFVAARTLLYGRALEAALGNAESHMKDRERCIKVFAGGGNDPLF